MKDFAAYLEKVTDAARGVNLKPDRVPENEFWLADGDVIVARSKLRHRLNAALEIEGGHIGYDVRPSARRSGYGTSVLRLTLEKAVSLGLKKVLLTCDADNFGSAKIIEKNGGKFAGEQISKVSGKPILRYWIKI